jgi:hypothetical protein
MDAAPFSMLNSSCDPGFILRGLLGAFCGPPLRVKYDGSGQFLPLAHSARSKIGRPLREAVGIALVSHSIFRNKRSLILLST